MLLDETLRERSVLGAAHPCRAGESRTQRSNGIVIERIARAQIVGDLANELVGDVVGTHTTSVGVWPAGIECQILSRGA